jgi:hypothetical protein
MPSLLEIAGGSAQLSRASGLIRSITMQIVLVSQSTRHPGSFNALKMAVIRAMLTVVGIQIPLHMTKKISLQDESDNELNLHYIDNGRRVQSGAESGSPAPTSIEQTRRMIYIGSFSARNKALSVKNQREIVKWVIGTHQTLIQYYPQIAEFRQKH